MPSESDRKGHLRLGGKHEERAKKTGSRLLLYTYAHSHIHTGLASATVPSTCPPAHKHTPFLGGRFPLPMGEALLLGSSEVGNDRSLNGLAGSRQHCWLGQLESFWQKLKGL